MADVQNLNYKNCFLNLIFLSIPLIIGGLAHILLGATDVYVASKHSVQTISAISIANAIFTSVSIAGIGLLSGISPMVSNYRGAKKSPKKYFLSVINFSLITGFIFCLITLLTIPFIDKCGFEPALCPIIKQYLFICAFSNIGGFLHYALKDFLQAYEILILPNLLSVFAIFLNFVLNYAFVFGFGIIPECGAVGLAIATFLTRTFMGLFLLICYFKFIKFGVKFDTTFISKILKVGYPVAIALLLEFVAFNMITLIVAGLDSIYAAVQGILIVISSITFTVPLAISNAIAIKVGFVNGAKNYIMLKKYSITGVLTCMIFMSFCSFVFFKYNREILSFFTNDEKLLAIAIPILIIVAIYQIFDGAQVAFTGILKGIKMTKIISLAILTGYWLLGLPLGFLFCFVFNMDLMGFWVGLATSIFILSVVLGAIVFLKLQKLRKLYC